MIRFPFKDNATSYKGGRSYIHGSDIVEEIESLLASEKASIEEITFLNPLLVPGMVVLTQCIDRKNAVAVGKINTAGGQTFFRVETGGISLQPERAYDENSIVVKKTVEDEFSVTLQNNTTMEHLLRGVKYASDEKAGQPMKWWFARMKEKKKSVPDIAVVISMDVKFDAIIAGRMTRSTVYLNKEKFCKIEFVGERK